MDFIYSIIIPHYNSSDLLQRMLKSIPEREDIQVIVVDDCSKNEEVEKLKQLQHMNLELYLESENRGAGHARNIGLNHVSGKWVLVVDADDIFAENAFDVFDKHKDSKIDYLCYRIRIITPDGAILGNNVSDRSVGKYLENKNKRNTNLFRFRNLVCWNKMVSSDFIKQYKLHFEESKVNNDVYYNLMIGLYGQKYEVIPDVLYHPIGQVGSITKKERTIEREFEFFLQAQKRNGFYREIGLNHMPFYRPQLLYIPFLIKKHGFIFTYKFFWYCFEHKKEIQIARTAYKSIFTM